MTLKYFNVKNGLVTGNITLDAGNSNMSANYFIGNISVTNTANLGDVGNVKITGGTNGYVLSTDGSGNLTWTAQTGSSGGALPDVVVDSFIADGSNNSFTLTEAPTNKDFTIINIDGVMQLRDSYTITGSTLVFGSTPVTDSLIEVSTFVIGTVSGGAGSMANTIYNGNSNVKVYANSDVTISSNGVANVVTVSSTSANITGNLVVSGTISGTVNLATYAGTANSVAVANVVGLGNLATINKDGNASNILYGNGVFASAPSASSQLESVVDAFIGDGTTINYTLSATPASKNFTIVMVDGVMQPRSAYTTSGTTISFSSAPPATAVVEVTTLGGNASAPTQTLPDILSPFMFLGI